MLARPSRDLPACQRFATAEHDVTAHTAAPNAKRKPRIRRRISVGRWIARGLCALFAVIGLAPVLIGALLRTSFVQQRAADEAQRLLREEAGLEAKFQVSVQPWPLSVIVRDLVIDSSNNTGPAIEATQLALRPRFFSMLQGRLNVGDIEVDRPRVRLVFQDGQLVNLAVRTRSPPKSKSPSTQPPFASIAVNGARFDVAVDGSRFRGAEVDLDVTGSEGPSFDVALRTGRVRIDRTDHMTFTGLRAPESTEGHHEDVVCALDARVRVEPTGVLVRRVRVQGVADLDPASNTRPSCSITEDDPRRVELELRSVRATLDDEGPQSIGGQVRARAPLRIANRFFPFLALEGWIAVDANGSWRRGQSLPEVRATVDGKGISFGVFRIASYINAAATIEGGVVRVPKARVGYADGDVEILDAEVRPLEEGIPLSATKLDLRGIQFPGLMRDVGVTDHTHVRMTLPRGTLSAVRGTIDPLRIDTDLVTQVRDFEVFDAAFDDPARKHVIGVSQAVVRAKFVVRPNAVEFHNGRAEFGSSHLNVFTSLGFSNEFRLAVSKGSQLDLADVSPLLDIPWSGKAEVAATINGVYSDPLIEGDLKIGEFDFAGLAFGDVQAGHVRFRPMVMDVTEVRGIKGTSPYRVPSMRLDFTGPAPVMADATIQSGAFDFRDFLSIFHFDTDPRFLDIHGVASAAAKLHYELGGARDRCGGGWLGVQARGTLRQVDLFEERYDGGAFDLDYEWFDRDANELGVRADIRSLVLRKGRGTIVGSGTIRRGGILRARAAVSDLPVSELQALGVLGSMFDASISATADVSGTLDRMEADVDVQVSPVRIRSTTLPASQLSVRLVPVDPPLRVVGRTQCGNPVTAPFDPVAYAKDAPAGVFEVRGSMFGGQVVIPDMQVTRQSHKVVRGNVVARALDIGKVAQLAPTFAVGAAAPQGVLSGALDIRKLALDSLKNADLSLVLTALDVKTADGMIKLRQGTPPITVAGDELTIPGVMLDFETPRGLRGSFEAGGAVHRVTANPELDLHARLTPTDLSSLANMVPRVERARGVVQASLQIFGSPASPRYRGEVSLADAAVSMRGLPVPVEDINVLVRIAEHEIRLERASARVGGGTVSAVGTLPVQGFDFGTATASITARDLNLPLIDGVQMVVSADLTASWTARLGEETRSIPRVVGDVTLVSFEYTRPVKLEADLGSLAQRARRTHFELYDPTQDVVDFEVRIRAAHPLRMRNNLADMQLLLDTPVLTLSGSNQRVGLRGALRVKPGSRVRLRANEFEVRDGLVRFDDVTRIAPVIDVTAVTEYRRYSGGGGEAGATAAGVSRAGGQWRIQLHAHGDADSLRLDLTSEPALSQEDIVLLLTLGVTRAELDQMQASSLGETAALEALSTLTGADSVVRETIPVIDDFRFGSSYSSRSGRTEPTVTVGKRVTERVRANVTSGLSDSREVRSAIEWQLTGKTSVLGSYDNVNNVSNSSLGNLGADIRFRITFE